MKSNAAGQLLGYAIQLPRALHHLLRGKPGMVVTVEHLGDVATINLDGSVRTEEDKSSVDSNPLNDRSTDLWKTLFNWITSIEDGSLDINQTWFILYSNKSGRKSIAHKFSDAQTSEDINNAIIYAKDKLKDLKEDHDAMTYYQKVMFEKVEVLKKIIPRFEIEIGTNVGFDEIDLELRNKYIASTQLSFIRQGLLGWVTDRVLSAIAEKKPAIITWEEFEKQFLVLFERTRRRELIDFTLRNKPDDNELRDQIATKPCYVRQLEIIENIEDDEILQAVSDFIRSKVNFDKWIEDDAIDIEIANDFEERLHRYWDSQVKDVSITGKHLTESEKALLILQKCKSRQETIRDMHPPAMMVPGTYHVLADNSKLGWHPKWASLFPKEADES